jgi:hypothetical protein
VTDLLLRREALPRRVELELSERCPERPIRIQRQTCCGAERRCEGCGNELELSGRSPESSPNPNSNVEARIEAV